MKSSSLKWTIYRIILLLTASILILNACRSVPGVPTRTQAPLPTVTSPTTPTAPNFTGLTVVDNGDPLPPTLLEQQPWGGDELPVDGHIILVFDQPMDKDKTACCLEPERTRWRQRARQN